MEAADFGIFSKQELIMDRSELLIITAAVAVGVFITALFIVLV